MRPHLDTRSVAAGGLFVVLLLFAEPAWTQHGGKHGAGSVGGHAGGGHGAGHAMAGAAGGFAGGRGGVAGFGYGAAYGLSYSPVPGASSAPYDGGTVFSTATPTGTRASYGATAGFAYYAPSPLMAFLVRDTAEPVDPPAAKRPPDDAGHFELIVPDYAEVYVNGVRTAQTGFVRHYNTPKLTPGFAYNYRVRVRYVDAHGDIVEDIRDIRFRANDWFRIDFTRLPPPTTVAEK